MSEQQDNDPSRVAAHSPQKQFACLQAGRALAAILVILYHNSLYIFIKEKYWGFDPARGLCNFTHAGVEFFFVLSGFIILYAHWDDLGKSSRFLNYVRKRFLRIYPMYWLVLAIIIPVYFVVPSFGYPYHRDFLNILSSVVLIFHDDARISELTVAWTLNHEALFYAIFSLAFLHLRLGVAAMTLWIMACSASFFTAFAFPLSFIASPLHLLIGMGMAACWILRTQKIMVSSLLLILGVMLFIAAATEEDFCHVLTEEVRNLLYGLGSALALVGLVTLEQQGRLQVPSWLKLIGDASYSIYLTHFLILSALAKLFIAVGAREYLPALFSYVALVIAVTGLGVVIHVAIEKPLLRKLARGFSHNQAIAADEVQPLTGITV